MRTRLCMGPLINVASRTPGERLGVSTAATSRKEGVVVEATVEAEVGWRPRRAVKREGIIGDRNCSRNGFGKLKGTSEISDLSIGEKVRRQQSFWTNIRQQRFWIPTVAYSPFRNSTTFRKDLGRRRRTKIQKNQKKQTKKGTEKPSTWGVVLLIGNRMDVYFYFFLACVQ